MPENLEALILLLFLLPGFVGLIVYEIVAEVPRRETFDKVVVAIALTVVASVLHGILGRYDPFFGSPAGLGQIAAVWGAAEADKPASSLAAARAIIAGLGWTTAIAAALGLVSAALQNWGAVHGLLRLLCITKRTGAIDVWHQVFSRGGKCWVRLLYKNGTVLVGWTRHFSEDSKTMALHLMEATWHVPKSPRDSGGVSVEFGKIAPGDITDFVETDVDSVLVTKFDDVVAIELLS